MTTLLAFVVAAMSWLAPRRDHAELATAIAAVVADSPALFEADEDRRKTAALIVAVAFRESSFRNDVVSKTKDFCVMQVNRRPDLAKDPVECIRVGLAMLRESMRACPAHPLAFYAAGPTGCTNARAQRISRDRLWLAKRVLAEVSR